jgi:hypothetical protein
MGQLAKPYKDLPSIQTLFNKIKGRKKQNDLFIKGKTLEIFTRQNNGYFNNGNSTTLHGWCTRICTICKSS